MGIKLNMLDQLTKYVDLPAENLSGTSVVELAGDSRVLVEKHKGVCVCGQNKICVNVCYGTVTVYGTLLEIVFMSKHQLIIKGKISGISLNKGR